ncbi:hypothetical protein GCK72_025167 [Caenorhabditis remanei]|uniref:Uncharacterized protein n=2 Tax=Caenorhabditis remanei TaxID=31234 RepID=E3MZB5_CAERE|nr:hypothetical protein GCK72_025167 [Caenorhabditis remanei]EFP12870.1 hypothetical protein CRE_05970 [Caenorhabditis remanei]KAF1748700.1 hypothetical protein GCK72_025167 [Caenorhabditis remanei]
MRFIPILLIAVLAFIVIIEGCTVGDCDYPERNPRPRPKYPDDDFPYLNGDNNKAGWVSEVTGVPNYKTCNSDEDCRHDFMELEIPRCTDGKCNNYTPDPSEIGRPF